MPQQVRPPHQSAGVTRPRLPLPGINAELIEAHLWALLSAKLMDRRRLRAGLRAARQRRAHDDAQHAARTAALVTLVEREQRRLNRCVQRINALDPDDASDREEIAALERDRDDAKTLLAPLRLERATLEREHEPAGLSDADVDELERLAAEVRAGLEHASRQERRRVLEMLNLRGTVWGADEAGDDLVDLVDLVVQKKPVVSARVHWSGEILVNVAKAKSSFLKRTSRARVA